MTNENKSWTIDNNTQASNRGSFRVNPLQWFKHYPKWGTIWLTGLFLFLAFGWLIHWLLWVAAAFFLVMNILYWKHVYERFEHGDLCAGVVIGLNPMLIAVSTDLTKGYGKYPVVKIIQKDVSAVAGELTRIGTRLATVALYSDSVKEELPHWEDFDPRPVDCATNNSIVVKKVMSALPEDEWEKLQNLLKQVPAPYKPGLYFLF